MGADNVERIVLEVTGDGEGAVKMLTELVGVLKDLKGSLAGVEKGASAGGEGLDEVASKTKSASW